MYAIIGVWINLWARMPGQVAEREGMVSSKFGSLAPHSLGHAKLGLRRQRYSSGVDWDPRITPVRTYNVPIHLFLPLSLNTGGVPWDHHFGDGSEPLWSSRPSEPEQRIGSYRKFVIFSDSGAYK
jgi:hypothetical protein